MESLQKSLEDMSTLFNTRMDEFHKSIQANSSLPTTGNTSSLLTDFEVFRSLVLTSLKTLNEQMQLLFKLYDQSEMRSRRKMILLHDIREEKKEDLPSTVCKLFADKLKLTDIHTDVIIRCHRLGVSKDGKPRPILVKFNNIENKNLIWYSKTAFKNTGVTASEFLTKSRHDLFLAARNQFGINKCWTKDGHTIIIGSNGQRYTATSLADLKSIPCSTGDLEGLSLSGKSVSEDSAKGNKVISTARSKRVIKAK